MSGNSSNRKNEPPRRIRNTDSPDISSFRDHRRERQEITAGRSSRDPYSPFTYDTPSIAPGHTIDDRLGVAPDELTLDHIFTSMDPHPGYQDEDLTFFNFLDDTHDVGGKAPAASQILDPSRQHDPSFSNIAAAPHDQISAMHPGMIMPADSNSASSFLPMSNQTRRLTTQEIDPHTTISQQPIRRSAFDSFSFTIPSMPPTHRPSSQAPLQLDPFSPWDLPARAFDDVTLSPLSEEPPASELTVPTTSKPASPALKMNRRKMSKDSVSPSTESHNPSGRPMKKSHNVIEKRYRLKLNDKILSLRNAVPALRGPLPNVTEDQQLLDSSRGGTSGKLNKGTVLTKATEYIKQLEDEKAALEQQVERLKEQLEAATRNTSGQDFERGGVAAASETQKFGTGFVVSTNGMLSPKSCISLTSPEAEGTLFMEVIEKCRPRKRVKIGRV
jgi:Helix-loop-helix DNA-binding domain